MSLELIIVVGGGYDTDYKKCIQLRNKWLMKSFGITYNQNPHPQNCGLIIINKYEVRFYDKYSDIPDKGTKNAKIINLELE